MNEDERFIIGSFFIDTEECTMFRKNGNRRLLTKVQTKMLAHLYHHNETTRDALIRAAWKHNDEDFEGVLDLQIERINGFFFDGSAHIDNTYENVVTLNENLWK